MAKKIQPASGDLFIEASGQLRMANKSAEQQALEKRPVECLGIAFESDVARREHFRGLLAGKLQDPVFRKIEGFPIGADEDILALSDPPYYTACPNPWLGDFLRYYGTPYDPKQTYYREPFAADVSEGKNHPIYNAHSYHTKVPHRAIMRYILHYTAPGDLVFDGFSGTGMTGVAAQLCGDRDEVQALGFRVLDDGSILNEEGHSFSRLGARRAILNDLSPAATFIGYNYNAPKDLTHFELESNRLLAEVESKYGWMYETLHADGKTKGRINYTIWSQIFCCPDCGADIIFWDAAMDLEHGKIREQFDCPHCKALLTKRTLQAKTESFFDKRLKQAVQQSVHVPALIKYSIGTKRHEKRADDADRKLANRIAEADPALWCPTFRMPEGGEARRNDDSGITHVHHFYTPRNLVVLAAFREFGTEFWAPFSALTPRATRMHRIAASRLGGEKEGVGGATVGVIAGTLYVPSLSVEMNVFDQAKERLRAFARAHFTPHPVITTTQSTTDLTAIADSSLDYIFVDPPFGANLMYSELNFLWEAWLGVLTDNTKEAVEDKATHKSLGDYRHLMTSSFSVMFRKLKPGRWLTVEFSNSRAEVWNSIQSSLQAAGFVVANVSALDKQQGSFKAVTTPTAVKQDLVISAYKPNGGLEERFATRGTTEEGVWDFLRTHLRNLPIVKVRGSQMEPIAERDPRILYDRMVAFYVGHSTPVPLSSGEFQAGLATRFVERDGMFFLSDQLLEYDKKRAQIATFGQLSVFVDDERSAIDWLRRFLKDRPSTYQDIQPEFMQQLGAAWKKWEVRPELNDLLEQNFLCFDGRGEVPSQIHGYMSTQFKELRNLSKEANELREKARDRWYVPNITRQADLEQLREKRLLRIFEEYKGVTTRKLKVFRIEALRAGFKVAYDNQDYRTIVTIAAKLPENVLQEDEKLLMYYDVASMRLGQE